MDYDLQTAVISMLISFTANIILCPIFIPFLTRLKFGQNVRIEGPKAHYKKAGTPTMGGIIIILSFVLSCIVFLKGNKEAKLVVFVTLGYGMIGFIDDYIKIIMKRSLGLRAWQKIILQLLVTFTFIYFLTYNSAVDYSKVYIPFANGKVFDLGILFIPFVLFITIGAVNAVNLTDGLDGLASGVTALVSTFFMFAAWASGNNVLPIAGAASGSLLGFLLFNTYPAKVFMGDTGSLALGGFVAAVSIILRMPLFLAIVGLVYVIEALSVIIQVTYFKITKGKRFFLMAPIHHHFELKGIPETKVVTVFYIMTAVLCLVGFLATKNMF